MAVIIEYRLVCEWCQKESEHLKREFSNPEQTYLRTTRIQDMIASHKRHCMHDTAPNCSFVKNVDPYKCWQVKYIYRDIETSKNIFGKIKTKREGKWIFFCCEDHLNEYIKIKNMKCDDWKI